ncbi:MAG: aldo/keto reductase [Marinilabiliales bacterium]|nr:aldo/keto reductase [Marinilabiliales bacterium]
MGQAIRDSGGDRNEIFVTSKLPAEIKSYLRAGRHAEFTMKKIGLDYIDLYRIHAPWPWTEIGADYTKEEHRDMEGYGGVLRKPGKTRSIGISNFRAKDIDAILDNCRIKPMVNQIKAPHWPSPGRDCKSLR